MTTANARGRVTLQIGQGRAVSLRITLAALDDIETAFEIASIADLEDRLTRPSAKDLAKLLAILAQAAGETITADELRRCEADIGDVIEAIRAAMMPNTRAPDAPDAPEKNAPAPTP